MVTWRHRSRDHSITHRPFSICFFRQVFGTTDDARPLVRSVKKVHDDTNFGDVFKIIDRFSRKAAPKNWHNHGTGIVLNVVDTFLALPRRLFPFWTAFTDLNLYRTKWALAFVGFIFLYFFCFWLRVLDYADRTQLSSAHLTLLSYRNVTSLMGLCVSQNGDDGRCSSPITSSLRRVDLRGGHRRSDVERAGTPRRLLWGDRPPSSRRHVRPVPCCPVRGLHVAMLSRPPRLPGLHGSPRGLPARRARQAEDQVLYWQEACHEVLPGKAVVRRSWELRLDAAVLRSIAPVTGVRVQTPPALRDPGQTSQVLSRMICPAWLLYCT